ncbi:hypothetical protein NDU88_009122 [Pleurodeles waltl]|uniref:Uncharacterized protein n=1 Tax=Pleurodeles waltl TaxID=8319 RepID=A0AAV7QSP4_PLEWA|nr:hypothetical protein NDU88_009122 [Pleurodeles waltl]
MAWRTTGGDGLWRAPVPAELKCGRLPAAGKVDWLHWMCSCDRQVASLGPRLLALGEVAWSGAGSILEVGRELLVLEAVGWRGVPSGACGSGW